MEHGDGKDTVYGAAEGGVVGTVEERAKYYGHFPSAGGEYQGVHHGLRGEGLHLGVGISPLFGRYPVAQFRERSVSGHGKALVEDLVSITDQLAGRG